MLSNTKNIKKTLKKLESNNSFNNIGFHKYIVSYKINDDVIEVFSNTLESDFVKKTRSNINKLNKIILKNRIEIQKRIDNYDEVKSNMLFMLFINTGIVCLSGFFAVLSFFTGLLPLLLGACITFSFSIISASLNGLSLYFYIKEIQNLKIITHYKEEIEYKIPQIDLYALKKN